jgi:predicted nucleotidyltransferase
MKIVNRHRGGRAVSRPTSFGREQRSRLARRAATARWARLGRGVLTLAQIRDAVTKALAGRKVKAAHLFDSYARGDATARDEIYLLIVEKMPEDLLGETADLTAAIRDALGDDAKEIVLYLADETTFNEWKDADGTPHHAVAIEGIRLA